ncbi:MAG: hypothetical protein KF690_11115 [Bacteroidetes bacterium]|nr:hypothetical protein [Bacteroidota bacterium]
MMKSLFTLALLSFLLAVGYAQTSGGPDNFGYTWESSHDLTSGTVADAGLYQWVDISATGTEATGLSDDNFVGPVSLGFDFSFYWQKYDKVYIGSNGYLMFGRGINIASETGGFPEIPSVGPASSPSNFIAPMLTDLTFVAEDGSPVPGTKLLYESRPDSFIITYLAVPFWNRSNTEHYSGSNTFQVILHSNGDITFNYLDQTGTVDAGYQGSGARFLSRGAENIVGNDGISMGNNLYPVAGSAIYLTYPASTDYEIKDVSSRWVFTPENDAVFLANSGNSYTIRAAVENTGNVDITAATPITLSTIVTNYSTDNVANVTALQSSTQVTSLLAGETQIVEFPVTIPTTLTAGRTEQIYRIRVRTSMTGDAVALNNDQDAQLIIVDTTRERMVLAHDRFAYEPNAGEPAFPWDYPYSGEDNFVTNLKVGQYFKPPFYPCYVRALEAGIVAFDNGEEVPDTLLNYHMELLADDGPDGAPGTLLSDVTVQADDILYDYEYLDDGQGGFVLVPKPVTNRHELDAPVLISSGGFYVSWQRDESDPERTARSLNVLATDRLIGSPFSFQTYEIQASTWAPYRDRPNTDFAIRAVISRDPFPAARSRAAIAGLQLGQCYPSPVALAGSQQVRLPLHCTQPTKVKLEVLGLNGAVVYTRPTELYPSGEHTLQIPLDRLAAGTWLCRITTPQGASTRTFVVQ